MNGRVQYTLGSLLLLTPLKLCCKHILMILWRARLAMVGSSRSCWQITTVLPVSGAAVMAHLSSVGAEGVRDKVGQEVNTPLV